MILQSFECGSWSLEWLNLPAFLASSRFHSPKDDITWWESLELALHAKRVWFAISSHLFSCSSRTQTHASDWWSPVLEDGFNTSFPFKSRASTIFCVGRWCLSG